MKLEIVKHEAAQGPAQVPHEIDGKPAVELPCPGRPLGDFAADVGRLLAGSGVYDRGGFCRCALNKPR